MLKNYIFDKDFYINFYLDIKNSYINDNIDPYEHYKNHGKREKRISCNDELTDIISKNLSLIDEQFDFLKNIEFTKTENKLNILIRTSKRPELFKQCMESILSQNYKNYYIYVCYDSFESYEYIKEFLNDNIETFFVENDSKEKYKFNLYNNELMEKVNDGFILFMDDDDIYSHELCFKIINETITDSNSVLIWKFMRPDKLIYPKHINDIKLGEIDTTMVCFNSKYKNIVKWNDCQCGDFFFYSELFNILKNDFGIKIIKVNYVLTKTNYHNKMCSSIC
jgi:hypothetical protein